MEKNKIKLGSLFVDTRQEPKRQLGIVFEIQNMWFGKEYRFMMCFIYFKFGVGVYIPYKECKQMDETVL